tara:strand:- start:275 stop:412 length:138 start_codon:yes stop_codon:yes gene_type:complete
MQDELLGIIIATLIACVIWELDERQVTKKHKKKKRIEQIEKQGKK